MIVWLLIGCMSVHKVGTLSESASSGIQARNADTLMDIAMKESWTDTAAARSFALQNIGLLRVHSPEILEGLTQLTRHHHPEIRRQAIWALGEVSREMEWDSASQTTLSSLKEALLRSRIQIDAEYIIDAMLKLYTPHVHSIKEDLSLLRDLQTYHAQSSEVPSNFYLLEREIQSIPVLLELMGEHLTGSIDQLYTSDLALIRYIERNRGALSAPQYRAQIQEVLNKEFELISVEHQSIQMLSLWMLANSAHNEILSEEVAVRLIEISNVLDDNLQVLLHMALWEMRDMEVVRRYFRTFLTENSRDEIHFILGMLGNKVDLIQELYDVPVSGEMQ